MKQLEERLRARGTEDENVLRVRLRAAQGEIENMRANPIIFKEIITNDEMEQGTKDLLHNLFKYYEHLREVDTGGN
jgi:guanylate kinase